MLSAICSRHHQTHLSLQPTSRVSWLWLHLLWYVYKWKSVCMILCIMAYAYILCFIFYFSKQVCTILVLNYHHRLASGDPMPRWVQTLFLQWIPWALRISRPGNKITRQSINIQNKVGYIINKYIKMIVYMNNDIYEGKRISNK